MNRRMTVQRYREAATKEQLAQRERLLFELRRRTRGWRRLGSPWKRGFVLGVQRETHLFFREKTGEISLVIIAWHWCLGNRAWRWVSEWKVIG